MGWSRPLLPSNYIKSVFFSLPTYPTRVKTKLYYAKTISSRACQACFKLGSQFFTHPWLNRPAPTKVATKQTLIKSPLCKQAAFYKFFHLAQRWEVAHLPAASFSPPVNCFSIWLSFIEMVGSPGFDRDKAACNFRWNNFSLQIHLYSISTSMLLSRPRTISVKFTLNKLLFFLVKQNKKRDFVYPAVLHIYV